MYEFLFLDLDDTILDFHKAERIALSKTIREFGAEPTEEILTLYHHINKAHWEMLERGELTRDQVLVNRFGALFAQLGMEIDARNCAKVYEKNLSIGHYFLPGAEETVDALSKKYRLFLASNGTASVQKGRMTSANLYRFFEKVFVSQEIGYNKPSKDYFERAFAQIEGFDRSKAIIVGDSLSSDILGGNNAGIATCWVNPTHAPRKDGIRVDYEIEALHQLPQLLEQLTASHR
jgi:2-haloacid dehalogenase